MDKFEAFPGLGWQWISGEGDLVGWQRLGSGAVDEVKTVGC